MAGFIQCCVDWMETPNLLILRKQAKNKGVDRPQLPPPPALVSDKVVPVHVEACLQLCLRGLCMYSTFLTPSSLKSTEPRWDPVHREFMIKEKREQTL